MGWARSGNDAAVGVVLGADQSDGEVLGDEVAALEEDHEIDFKLDLCKEGEV